MIALVTGANRGIGLELVRQLSARGDEVIAVCRKLRCVRLDGVLKVTSRGILRATMQRRLIRGREGSFWTSRRS